MGKKPNLKAALASQQSRLKQNSKAKESAQRAQKQASTASVKSHKGPGKSFAASRGAGGEQDRSDGKGKAKADMSQRKITIPFQPTDTILLIGEGNFSFAHALSSSSSSFPPFSGPSSSSQAAHALRHLPLQNITATAYDSEEECYDKYPEAREIVRELRERKVELLFGVNATQLEKCKSLKGRRWDRVVWNFPHAGEWSAFSSLL